MEKTKWIKLETSATYQRAVTEYEDARRECNEQVYSGEFDDIFVSAYAEVRAMQNVLAAIEVAKRSQTIHRLVVEHDGAYGIYDPELYRAVAFPEKRLAAYKWDMSVGAAIKRGVDVAKKGTVENNKIMSTIRSMAQGMIYAGFDSIWSEACKEIAERSFKNYDNMWIYTDTPGQVVMGTQKHAEYDLYMSDIRHPMYVRPVERAAQRPEKQERWRTEYKRKYDIVRKKLEGVYRRHGEHSPEYAHAVLVFNAESSALRLEYEVPGRLLGRKPRLLGIDYNMAQSNATAKKK